jgi:hypothetical protein
MVWLYSRVTGHFHFAEPTIIKKIAVFFLKEGKEIEIF